jgi:ParB-like chromosome segregation protein Spo0J
MTSEIETVSLKSINLDKEFQRAFMDEALKDYEALREDIREEQRIRIPLVVGIIDEVELLVDGYHRHLIGTELGIEEVPIIKMPFTSREEAKTWIVQNQIMRRNLNPFRKIEFALQRKDYYAAKAKENQRAAGGAVSEKCQEPVDTYKELAKLAGTSDKTVRNVEKILKLASKKDIDALRRGDATIHSVYQTCTGKMPADKQTPRQKVKPPSKEPPDPQGIEELVAEQEGTNVLQTKNAEDFCFPPEESEEHFQPLMEEFNSYRAVLDTEVEDYKSTGEHNLFLNNLLEWTHELIEWINKEKAKSLQTQE